MFVSIFKSNHRIVTVFVLVLIALLGAPFFGKTDLKLITHHPLIDYLIFLSLVGFQAIYFNRIINREKLVANNTYLTSLFIAVLNGAAFMLIGLNEVIVANTFVVLSLFQLFKIYNEKYKMAEIFNAALLMGIASAIYQPYLVYMLLIIVILFYLTTPVWRDFVVLILGYVLPFLYVMAYEFVVKGTDFLSIDLLEGIDLGFKLMPISRAALIFVVTVGVYGLVTAMAFIRSISGGVVKVRKLLWTMVIVGLFGWMTLILNAGNLIQLFVTLSLPLAIVFANFFERNKSKWFAELLFAGLLVSMIWIYFS